MHIPILPFLGVYLWLTLPPTISALRFAMYIDKWHTTDLPGREHTSGITHAIMAFAESTLFNADSPSKFEPFEPVETMRARFDPGTKLLVAIGGWGDTEGFSLGAKDEASRARYAKNVAAMVEDGGFDGVDIDWEYPGGNGADYKKTPNSEKVSEIETFPLFMQALRKALGKDKLLSIAVPGKRIDMIAFTKENGPKIWPTVDMVNVMSYDMMNRRNNVTTHHSSVAGSLDTVHAYVETGLEPAKMNLGVAYYAKWFTTAKDAGCEKTPVGCAVVELEKADGSDAGTSGVLTFEKGVMGPAPGDLKESTDGTCGFAKKMKCPRGQCCSQYGSCGTTDEFCQGGCLSDYGECKGISVIDSWRRAEKDGQTDEKAGGQYFFDAEVDLFWTWETVPLVERKFKDIVDAEKVGGVMAWSLGEDTLDFALVEAMARGAKARATDRGETGERVGEDC